MNEFENEKELIDYINVIWKRKWLIIIPTFILVIAVGVYSFLLPPVWEVNALIQPGKYIVQTEGGTYKEILVADPKQITGQINEASYNNIIAAELNLDIREFPKLKADNIRDTKLVRISIKENDVEKAKLILYSLFNHLKRELDKKVDVEIKGIDSKIKSKEIENLRIEEEIKAHKNKLNIVKQRKKEIEEEVIDIRKRVEALEKEQSSSLKKEKRSESESLAMLLYSNEIQQSLRYHNTLNELLSSKKIQEENINLEMKNKEKRIKQLENEIDNLSERKGRIDYTQFIQEPTSSLSPVSPKKKQNVTIAGVLGLFIFTILAFFIEYLEKQKVKSRG
jgi:capsular polysaccharide biosynthesis protein